MSLSALIYYFILPVIGISFVMAFIRLLRGPGLADRVVALDLASTEVMALMIAYAIATRQQVFLDVAIIIALISFLGTIAFAKYLEKRV